MIKKGKKEINNEVINDHPELFTYDDGAVKRVQDELLAAYCDLWDFCEKNGILLFLTGGTTLGAIRHQGFIPWDDDIDLAIPRKDYMRFQALFEKEMGGKYTLNAPNYSKNPLSRFPKVLIRDVRENGERLGFSSEAECLPVDIFIIENVPENRLLRTWKGLRCNFCELMEGKTNLYLNRRDPQQKLFGQYRKLGYALELIIGFFGAIVSPAGWKRAVDRINQYDNEATALCGTPSGRKHYFGEIYEKKDFFPGQTVLFEGKAARVFTNPHKYLTHLYGGDYMTPPPPEKREHHLARGVCIKQTAGEQSL